MDNILQVKPMFLQDDIDLPDHQATLSSPLQYGISQRLEMGLAFFLFLI